MTSTYIERLRLDLATEIHFLEVTKQAAIFREDTACVENEICNMERRVDLARARLEEAVKS